MDEWIPWTTVVSMAGQILATRRYPLLVWLGWGALLALVYGFAVYPALKMPFVLDDHSKIVLNPDIRSLEGLWSKLIYPYGLSLVSTRNDPSRPFVYLLYTLLYSLWGADPAPFHVLNLVLHALNAGLVVWMMREMLTSLMSRDEALPFALLGGAFFLLTPINISTAAYIYGLSDVLSLTWILMAMACHGQRDKHPAAAFLGISVATVLALSAKQIAVLVPMLLALYDGLVTPTVFSLGWGRLLRRYSSSLLPVVLYLTWRYGYFGRLGDLEGTTHVKPLSFYLLAQAHAILHYIGASFVPVGLCLDHDLPYPPNDLTAHLLKLVLLASLSIGAAVLLWQRRADPRARLALFGLFFVALWLAPTSSFIPTVDYMVERRIYGGTVGLSAILVSGTLMLKDLFGRRKALSRAAGIVLLAYGGLFGLLSHGRLTQMQDEKSLWQEVLHRYPWSYRALGNLANAYIAEKNFPEALGYYHKIMTLLPDHATTVTNLAFVYAAVHSPVRDLDKAKMYLRRALELDPKIAEAWQNLGLVVMEQGHIAEAESYFRKAIEVDPRHVGAYNQLCALMLDQRRFDEARVYLDISRSLVPAHPMVIENARRLSEGR